jgi:hypothetical protein
MRNEQLRDCTGAGTSVLVGTVDAEGFPSCCRGIAVTTRDDFDSVTVYVPAATGQETVANVATTRRIAVGCSNPIEHTSVQIKGVTRSVRVASSDELQLVSTRLQQFAEVLESIGLPRRLSRSLTHWPAFAIDVSVEEVFDQTPGPQAGTMLP